MRVVDTLRNSSSDSYKEREEDINMADTASGIGVNLNAITDDAAIRAILKTWYKDGIENLFFRNSPVLKELKKTRVEGKEQRFAAIYGRGGAVSAKATQAKAKALATSKNAEFVTTPGKLFSMFSYSIPEVQASKSKRGAYMKIAGNKAFAAAQALRQTLAGSLYGRGYGELAVLGTANATALAAGVADDLITITLPSSVNLKIDVDSDIVLKTSVGDATEHGLFTVTKIDGDNITVKVVTAYSSAAATNVVCLRGSVDGSGNPLLPVGLAGWLPSVGGRTGSDWTTYIHTPFMGVTRDANTEALAGNFVYNSSNTKKSQDIQQLLQKVRRHGGEPDFIVMNDKDWLAVAEEIQSTNTYFTQTSTASKRKANIGLNKITAGFSTNYIDIIYDDPYCPEGTFYMFNKEDVELWTYTNAETPVQDGVASNNPGKQDPMEYENKGKENDNFKLLIDDFITVVPGETTDDGDAVRVTYNFFGQFVVLNPADTGVGIFHDATLADIVSTLA